MVAVVTNMLVPGLALSALLVVTSVHSAPTKNTASSPAHQQDGEGKPKDMPEEKTTSSVTDPTSKKPSPLKTKPVATLEKHHSEREVEKNLDAIVIPENFNDLDDVKILKIFSSLYYERRKLKFYMLLYSGYSLFIKTVCYYLRSNHLLYHLFSVLDDRNETWGENIVSLWVNHQERMADFLLRLMEKKNIDPKTMAETNMKVEYKHKKFVSIPVYRTYPGEPLPDAVKDIRNKINLWDIIFN